MCLQVALQTCALKREEVLIQEDMLSSPLKSKIVVGIGCDKESLKVAILFSWELRAACKFLEK